MLSSSVKYDVERTVLVQFFMSSFFLVFKIVVDILDIKFAENPYVCSNSYSSGQSRVMVTVCCFFARPFIYFLLVVVD